MTKPKPSAAGRAPKAKAETKIGTRAQTYRIRRIHEILKAGTYPTTRELAEELEVTERCIYRDIADMHTYHQLPIEVEGPRGGYYYPENEVAELPSTVTLTKAELTAFFVAAQAMEPVQTTRLARALRSGLRKIFSEVKDVVHADLGMSEGTISFGGEVMTENLDVVTGAIQGREELQFDYTKLAGSGKPECRRVRPLAVTLIQGVWYLLAQDLDRAMADRTFNLARMSALRRTGKKFERPKNFSPKKALKNAIGIYGGEPVRVVIRFTGMQARLIGERKWHPTQLCTALPDGTVECEMHLAETPELLSWVLARGSDAEVLEPLSLRKAVEKQVRGMAELYR